ncbi:serine/threonine-protein kinase [Microbacterium sp. SORGH_AS_0888]|uniref:serine/threonine-protein kinase n=1 Tax=Microbacterium sp. SORGH_AS_0888 TaxID=3041791 RepID=UPI00277E380F|nr:serine/threonine-protein kinase [Microbacterium sp. SORGH_AS_0888]MDQ1129165.1 serine/threonine protein kinase [Microbacterium sp. SORGH_AS_0888]
MIQPPALPGLSVEGLIHSGASADVYLCRRLSDGRSVAVKVFRAAPADAEAARAFLTEAAALVALSSHPAVVTIHHADVAPDGRALLVMEHCSRPGVAERLRAGGLSVAETLQTMIRISGAVESAHRAGILHRALAPAHVLTTDYGWPALGGFDVSTIASGAAAHARAWSAPEVLAGAPAEPRSDVYGLAATTFTLLAGTRPFDPDGRADDAERTARILSAPVPVLPRSDAPEALHRILRLGMAKDPSHRPASAAEFALALQRVEQELNLPTTHLDVAGSVAAEPEDRTTLVRRPAAEPDDRTSIVSRPEPDDRTTRVARDTASPVPAPRLEDRTMLVRRPPAEPEDRTTVVPRRQPSNDAGPEPEDRTMLVRRPAAEPEDRTSLVQRPEPEDRTMLRGARPPRADAPTGRAAPAASRTAYDPGAEGAQRLAYGVRDALPTPPVQRAAPSPVAPPIPTSGAASHGRARARLRRRLILLAAGTALVLAATICAIVLLATAG